MKNRLPDSILHEYKASLIITYGKLDKKKYGEGVFFTTYSTLIGKNKKKQTRLDQLVKWCGGEDFDGLIM